MLRQGNPAWSDWRRNNPLVDPDLQEADLSNLDLRSVDLTRANLTDAKLNGCNLVGTDLREATLRRTDLRLAVGLLPDQLAGADLAGAGLPEAIDKFFSASDAAKSISENAQKLFIATLAACLYSWLTIATTTDSSLVTNRASSPLPIIQTSIPIVSFYVVAPLLLMGVFFYCHFYLQKLWEALASLPAVFPDGRPLQTRADPWLLSDLVRSHVRKLRDARPFLSHLQAWVSVLLAWGTVPATLLLFWARYLPRHDLRWTVFHAILAGVSITGAIFFYRLSTDTLRGAPPAAYDWKAAARKPHTYAAAGLTLLWSLALMAVSLGAIHGVRTGAAGRDCWPQATGYRTWAPRAMKFFFRYSTFADIGAADLSLKPAAGNADLASVKGLQLHGADLSYADLSSAYLPVAVLTDAHLQGAELLAADLRQTELSGADLQEADLAGANLEKADLTDADIKYADFRGAKGLAKLQVQSARNWKEAFYDDSLLAELELPAGNNDRVRLSQQHDGGIAVSADRAACVASQLRRLTPGKSEEATTLIALLVGGNGVREVQVPASTPEKTPGYFSVPQLAQLYNFPANLDGRGQTIGIVEFGGGYRPADLSKYFSSLSIKQPAVTAVSVNGTGNSPGGSGADAEVELNVEVVGAIAPASQIVVYFSSFTLEGWIDAIHKATRDPAHKPSVLLICWGLSEGENVWTAENMQAVDGALREAADLGITVVVAAGDNGAANAQTDAKLRVDFPASSQWVLAVGGTRMTATGKQIQSEVPWNDSTGGKQLGATGGGVSDFFPLPAWQSSVKGPLAVSGKAGRLLPDVAADASAETGIRLVIDGQWQVTGGTSLSSSLWAGLIALLNQGLGRNLGYFNPLLYQKVGPGGSLRSITGGTNGSGAVKGYSCGAGWNPCAGWGSPDGQKLLEALRSMR